MSALASLSQRYSHIVLFIVCECIAFFLIVNFNRTQRDIFLHSSSLLSGKMLETTTDMKDFVGLKNANKNLQKENAELLQRVFSSPGAISSEPDSSAITFEVIPAKVINNGIMSVRNYITLDVGRDDGVSPSMGVITPDGVVGIVKRVGKNFTTVLSMLHLDTRISSSTKEENFFGTTSWEGAVYNELSLSDIPRHAQINQGDSIVTNGFSTIFPKGIDIGVVASLDVHKSGAFYDITLTPTVDFANLEYVYLLKGNFAEELISIQSDE